MEYTQDRVAEIYNKFFTEKLNELTNGTQEAKERDAQKFAIKQTTLFFFKEEINEDKKDMWSKIYTSHVTRKAGVEISQEAATKVISADQSWKKSSGHAFEEVVKEMSTESVVDSGITVVLQRDAKKLIDEGKIKNERRDIEWLKPQIQGGVFDLFVIKDGFIFGCVQAKTSIRDRVTRDREPSMNAMNHFFWSIAFVLDGDFLKLPKFQHMVNGGSEEFIKNGWHGMYVFSIPDKKINTRIHHLSSAMSPFKEHALRAADDWFNNRQWFNNEWLV